MAQSDTKFKQDLNALVGDDEDEKYSTREDGAGHHLECIERAGDYSRNCRE